MDSSYDVPDPSDWLGTAVYQLGPVEGALRCQVCKDFFDTPVITSCSHTFCSLCIRRCLTNDGICPACRAQDQISRLKPNPVVEELVDAFKLARPSILQLGRQIKDLQENSDHGKLKRKLSSTDNEDRDKSQGRRTRSQNYRSPIGQANVDQVLNEDSDDAFQPDDGLTACPICRKRMKEQEVFSHLDIHVESNQIPTARSHPFPTVSSTPHLVSKSMERLPQLNYSLLKDNALRKKLAELGVPNGGPRTLLIRRHTEWVNLVNANCDSRKPRSKRELLSELDHWDKTQGRQIVNGSGGTGNTSVMNKDFDGAAWAAVHDIGFQQLVTKAREKVKSKKAIAGGLEDVSDTGLSKDGSDNATADTHNPDGEVTETNVSMDPISVNGDSVKAPLHRSQLCTRNAIDLDAT